MFGSQLIGDAPQLPHLVYFVKHSGRAIRHYQRVERLKFLAPAYSSTSNLRLPTTRGTKLMIGYDGSRSERRNGVTMPQSTLAASSQSPVALHSAAFPSRPWSVR